MVLALPFRVQDRDPISGTMPPIGPHCVLVLAMLVPALLERRTRADVEG
jgi:hypothetical protein